MHGARQKLTNLVSSKLLNLSTPCDRAPQNACFSLKMVAPNSDFGLLEVVVKIVAKGN